MFHPGLSPFKKAVNFTVFKDLNLSSIVSIS